VGVTRVEGQFQRGDTVRICNEAGREIARGLSRYGAASLEAIRGHRSEEISAILGYEYGAEVVHRDDLVVL
jgi:glutamate 5-kinase